MSKKDDEFKKEFSKWMGKNTDEVHIDSELFNEVKLDHFYKSLVFQTIFDKDLNRDERDVLLVIFRKTIHFNKMWDRISIGELSDKAGPCERIINPTLKRLQGKALIDIYPSKGGRSSSRKRFNAYRLSTYLLEDVWNKYRSARRDHDHWAT